MSEEVWRYLGRRVLQGGGLGHLYSRPTGEDAMFMKPLSKRPAVGAFYRVNAVTTDTGVSVRGAAMFDHGQHDDTLALQDAAATAQDEATKAHEKLRAVSGDFGDLTINEVRDMVRNSLPARRTALLAVILRKVTS